MMEIDHVEETRRLKQLAFARSRRIEDRGPMTRFALAILDQDQLRSHPRRREIIEMALALDENLGLDGQIAPPSGGPI